MIIRLMRLHREINFIIIGDYQSEVLKKYLKKFSPLNNYSFIKAQRNGSCAGIKECLKVIPENEPFLLIWCDLYFYNRLSDEDLEVNRNNYIGLSKNFYCRWSFREGQFIERKSKNYGIAGIYTFKNKEEIKDIPEEGEFCRYLSSKKIEMKPFNALSVTEVGTINKYARLRRKFPNSRPFNKIEYQNNLVIKTPLDEQGKKLANYEQNWYKATTKNKWDFIPRVKGYSPFCLQRIEGQPLFKYRIKKEIKKTILKMIVLSLKKIHSSVPSQEENFFENNYEAILSKTRKRIDEVANLIPGINNDHFFINNRNCINFYKHWDLVIPLLVKHFSNTYKLIHGDITFSNILYVSKKNNIFFIDPRGYFGEVNLFGDEDYDWAKLYYSIVGNYDQFNIKNFALSMDEKASKISLKIKTNNWSGLEDYFFKLVERSPEKIKAYHAIIWLSLTSYAWDDYDSMCGAFYNGIYLMQDVYQKTL